MKIKVMVHSGIKQSNIDLQNCEIEIEENSSIETLLKNIGIQNTEEVMAVANETLVPIKTSLNNIYEIKIYPIILGG